MPAFEEFKTAIVRFLPAAHSQGKTVGVGALVTEEHIVTCAHVINAALGRSLLTTEPPPGETLLSLDFPLLPGDGPCIAEATVMVWDIDADVAVLQLRSARPDAARPVAFVESVNPWGHDFRAYGVPNDQNGVWASGKLREAVANGRIQIEDVNHTGYFIQPGFSGGPVWDEAVQGVVGMVATWDPNPGVRAGRMIPAHVIARIWPELPVVGGTPAAHNPAAVNPFTEVGAIHEPAKFIGREADLARLQTMLKGGSVALIGEPKIGKSSLLLALKRGWPGTMLGPISLHSLEDADDFYAAMARTLGLAGYDWRADLRPALREVDAVLLIDELDAAPGLGLTRNDFRRLRSISDQNRRFKLVIAARRPLKEIIPDDGDHGSPWYNLILPHTLGSLDEDEARSLLGHPWQPDAPRLDPAVQNELIAITACHPFKLQRAAFHRYEDLSVPGYDWRASYTQDMEHLL